MKIQWLIVLSVFLLGVIAGALFSTLSQNLSGLVVLDSKGLESVSAPSDYLNESSVIRFDDKLVIKVKNSTLSSYASSGSMLPFITNTSNGIVIVPSSASEIHVGDIVSFTRNNATIVHRIVRISSDEKGIYFVTKGDNVKSEDEMIRFDDIRYKLVGILY